MNDPGTNAQRPSLFDASGTGSTGRTVLSVSALTAGVRAHIEEAFDDVWVEGELSNFKQHSSGHCYFTLKDADAQLRCVMWRHFTRYVFFQPRDGMLVTLHGKATLYEPRGEFQLVARSMQLAGEGALQRAFEALRERLEAEGLFAPERKRPLPPFPETIGVVTSGDGAALRDILSILGRRFPQVRVLVCPVKVQGMGAAQEIADAIEAFNALPEGGLPRPDVLITGRGGGSLEDLWAFNEEVVARALFASRIPVISAVGHEVDYTIADFVADRRAATPSMAAELAVPDRREVEAFVRAAAGALEAGMGRRIDAYRQHVRFLTRSYAFHRPLEHLNRNRREIGHLTGRLHRAAAQHTAAAQHRLAALSDRLLLLDPARPFRQGYARVERDGRAVRSARSLSPGDAVTLRFHDGRQEARIQ